MNQVGRSASEPLPHLEGLFRFLGASDEGVEGTGITPPLVIGESARGWRGVGGEGWADQWIPKRTPNYMGVQGALNFPPEYISTWRWHGLNSATFFPNIVMKILLKSGHIRVAESTKSDSQWGKRREDNHLPASALPPSPIWFHLPIMPSPSSPTYNPSSSTTSSLFCYLVAILPLSSQSWC